MDCLSLDACETVLRAAAAPWSLAAKIQLFGLIQPVYALVIVCKAFTTQQDIDSPESVSHACGGDLAHAHTQQLFVPVGGLTVVH